MNLVFKPSHEAAKEWIVNNGNNQSFVFPNNIASGDIDCLFELFE